jgi:hypothetical protein
LLTAVAVAQPFQKLIFPNTSKKQPCLVISKRGLFLG